MKECEKYAALLDAFSEGDLFLEDMIQVQTHLMNCPGCQAYLEDLMAMRAAFPTVEDTEVPEGFADRVMAAVATTPQATTPAKSKKTPWRKLLVPLAACCALVILLGRTALMGGSNAPAAKLSARSETAVAEECAIEEPKASAPAETAAGTLLNDTAAYSYTAETEAQNTAKSKDIEDAIITESTAETAPAEAAPAAAQELILTTQQAGDLLSRFTPAEESETEIRYELTAQEYVALLTALPREVRQSAPANTAEIITVVVLK